MDAHTGVVLTCSKCPNHQFRNSQSHRRHADWHKRGKVYLECKMCGNKFKEKYQLESHMVKHQDGELTCPVNKDCKQMFKHKGDQQRHANFAHRETKDFACPHCDKKFKSPHSMGPHRKKCSP